MNKTIRISPGRFTRKLCFIRESQFERGKLMPNERKPSEDDSAKV